MPCFMISPPETRSSYYSTPRHSRLLIQLGDEPRGRHLPVRLLHDLGDLLPVHAGYVEVDAQPAPMPHIRGHEEALGIGSDHRLLLPGRRGAPERQTIVVVMVG